MADQSSSVRRYYVVSRGDGWDVVADCHYLARFSDRDTAVRQAIDWAQIDGTSGESAQVLIEVRDDEFRVTWSHGIRERR